MSLEDLKIRLEGLIDNWDKEMVKIEGRLVPFPEIRSDRLKALHIINSVLHNYLHNFGIGDEVRALTPTQQEQEEWKVNKKLLPYMHTHYWGFIGEVVAVQEYSGKVLVKFKGLDNDAGFPNPAWVSTEFIEHNNR